MTRPLDDTTTADDVLDGIDLHDMRILVTGVSAGIGVETARALLARGAKVVGAVRDPAKAERATKPLRETATATGGELKLVGLDLANLASVRSCADRLLTDGRPFDAIIANAGVMATPFGYTTDGFEMQLGTNHLGHFLLVNRLSPLIRQGGRVVVVASAGHRFADVDLDDPNFERTPYAPFVAYGRSKTANVLFAVAFDRRHKPRSIRAAAVHPGAIKTELGRYTDVAAEADLIRAINERNAVAGVPPFRYKSVAQGAATSVWAAVAAPADEVGGSYCEDCHVAAVINDPGLRNGVQAYAVDADRAEALWALSERLVGERFDPVH